MQKLITVTIDIKHLQAQTDGPFTVTEIAPVNDLLEAGWAVEDYEFLSGSDENDKAVLMVMLNDSSSLLYNDDFAYAYDDDPEDDEEVDGTDGFMDGNDEDESGDANGKDETLATK